MRIKNIIILIIFLFFNVSGAYCFKVSTDLYDIELNLPPGESDSDANIDKDCESNSCTLSYNCVNYYTLITLTRLSNPQDEDIFHLETHIKNDLKNLSTEKSSLSTEPIDIDNCKGCIGSAYSKDDHATKWYVIRYYKNKYDKCIIVSTLPYSSLNYILKSFKASWRQIA
jgi:hypothetical protein